MRQYFWLAISSVALASSLTAQLTTGDQQFAARANGHVGARAAAAPIDGAIAAYQRAVTQDPNDLEARWKLLRAYRFKGAYVASTDSDKKSVYASAKIAGDEAMSLLGRLLRAKGLATPAKANEREVANAARSLPGAAEVFLWDSVNWGEWALAYGKLAAVREGAADRIRREATIADLIDPAMEDGAPSRVLGRLHDQTPHVPFITGWASSREAVKYLRKSLGYAPANKITRVFLAEALVDDDSSNKPEAVRILRETVAAKNASGYEVEEEGATADARAFLREWGG